MIYNFETRKEINPLNQVNSICCQLDNNNGQLNVALHRGSPSGLIQHNGYWKIVFPISSLRITSVIKWFDANRGTFKFGNSTIHFRIEGDVMFC